MGMTQPFGCKPDDKDDSDHKFMLGIPIRPGIVLPRTNLGAWMPPWSDQGAFGTCTAESVIKAMGYDMLNITGKYVKLSAASNYLQAGLIEGNTQDVGRQIRDAVKAAATFGVPEDQYYPYSGDDFGMLFRGETPESTANAALHKVSDYQRVLVDEQSIDMALYTGRPVIVGVDLFQQCFSDEAYQTGKITMPPAGATPIGRHAVPVFNNDNHEGAYWFQNHWLNWGPNGNGFFPRGYITKYGGDLWTLYAITNNEATA